jgi:hypothetical protein
MAQAPNSCTSHLPSPPRPPPPRPEQRRLQRHEESALAKYYELDRRLRADPRLALLLAPA